MGLSSSFDSTVTPTTEGAESRNTLPRSYVNFDIDELNKEPSRERRLRSLSPLELSIERELEKTQRATTTSSSEERVGEEQQPELHTYANWQFEKMNNEKAQKLPAPNSRSKPLLNGVPTGKQEGKPSSVMLSPPRKPLKPPSPFRLQNLSDLTAVGTSPPSAAAAATSRVAEASPQKVLPQSSSVDSGEDTRSGRTALGKALSTSKLHEVSPTDTGRGWPGNAARNADQILPSQLNLGGKPRSFTTSHYLAAKKKPILPPGGGGGGGGGGAGKRRASLKSRLGKRQEKGAADMETLESSGEMEKPGDKEPTVSSSSSLSGRRTFLSLGREAGRGAATKSDKAGSPTSELLRKLSLRRQRLEQQLMASGKHTSGSTTASSTGGGDSSSRTSTSSTQSELVCSYNMKRSQDDLSGGSSLVDVEFRSKDEASLAKYGIVEEGGTFEI